ncbi:hypothetical protein KCP74_25640 (plasmid) [Salmonella enterica subsp. enterica]|nr:hypothetical protein KCP74_25640 [Salmonella enterica subsp. enterica]QUJ01288.1 hypothetical protein KCP73_26960 [Salmonella enterica subsp. enterica]
MLAAPELHGWSQDEPDATPAKRAKRRTRAGYDRLWSISHLITKSSVLPSREAQRLNKETQTGIKNCVPEMGLVGRDA